MSYFKVYNEYTKVQMLCNMQSSERAKELYNNLVQKRPKKTKIMEVRPTVEYIVLKQDNYILYADNLRLAEIIKTLNNREIKIEALTKEVSTLKVDIKKYEAQIEKTILESSKLQDENKCLNARIQELETDSKSLSEKLAQATAKTVKKTIKK